MDADIGRGESPQVGTRTIVLMMSGILVVLVLVAFGFEMLFSDRIGQTFVARRDFPAPAVIPNERGQRLALEARQQQALSGGGGRMSIAAAMDRIASKGPHAFDPVEARP
jgi:hypothetical protein